MIENATETSCSLLRLRHDRDLGRTCTTHHQVKLPIIVKVTHGEPSRSAIGWNERSLHERPTPVSIEDVDVPGIQIGHGKIQSRSIAKIGRDDGEGIAACVVVHRILEGSVGIP